MCQKYQWEFSSSDLKVLKLLGLIAGGSYLAHLHMDAHA